MIGRKISKRKVLLIVLDMFAFAVSVLMAQEIRNGLWDVGILKHPVIILGFFVYLTLFYIFDLYYPFKRFKKAETLIDVVIAVVLGSLVLGAISFIDRTFAISRLIFAYSAMMLAFLTYTSRVLYDAVFYSHVLDQKTLIIGTGPLAKQLAETLDKTVHSGIDLVGFISIKASQKKELINNVPVVGALKQLISLISWHNINMVILAMEPEEESSETDLIYALLKQDVKVTSAVHHIEKMDECIPYQAFGEQYLISLMEDVKRYQYLNTKRIIDVIFSLLIILLALPIFVITAILLLPKGWKNIFFIQSRIGLNGKPFNLIKFRTINEIKGDKGKVTSFGKFLRKFRIDELPQLFNVLKGDMSLVGPRPEIPYFVDLCKSHIPLFTIIFAVKPGLTGWAQVKFRYTMTKKDYEKKFCYNLYYLKNISLVLDLIILLKTIRSVLLGKGQ